jgi:protein translocase SecG subunit
MNWLLVVLTIVSILLITLILLQKANTDGTGALGGDGNMGGGNRKRGLEKTIFQTTILVAIVFAFFNLIAIFVK